MNEPRRSIIVEALPHLPVEEQIIELVERKGVGHPDSICDGIAEEISVALNRAYVEIAGRVLHYNVDKALLVAGRSEPRIGGGRVLEPMRFVLGDRATDTVDGKRIPIHDIAEEAAERWVRQHLRFVDTKKHFALQSELRPGSPELVDIFERQKIGANDTSAAVGYAPLSETERLVLAAERYLNGDQFKQSHPAAGEDVKVMGIRRGRALTVTVALAFVDRFVESEQHYFSMREAIRCDLENYLKQQAERITDLEVEINTLDEPGRGEAGMYLTVLGTSAEGGDGGQVGRGNRVSGVIPLNRPVSSEAAAGKNPVSHVGKIYNLLSYEIAQKVYSEVEGLQEVYVWLCSKIGQPIDQPPIAAAQVVLAPGVDLSEIQKKITDVVDRELTQIDTFVQRLIEGKLNVW
jgi:S-adenosylmethionine synthetase